MANEFRKGGIDMNTPLRRILAVGVVVAVVLAGLVWQAGTAEAGGLKGELEETGAEKLSYKVKQPGPVHKFARGLKNIILAPVEVPAGIATYSKKNNPFITLFIGPLFGAGNSLTRAVAGVAEIISFPLPPYDRPFYDLELGQSLWGEEI